MIPNELPPKSTSAARRTFSFGGSREYLSILILLILFSQAGGIFYSILLLFAASVVLYWYVRGCFRFGKVIGIVGMSLPVIVLVIFSVVQYQAHLTNQILISRLNEYDKVKIWSDGILATSPIIQITLGRNMSDSDLETLADFPELNRVTRFFLENCEITDDGLKTIDRWANVEYIFIESRIISDDAIVSFALRHRHCSVIPFRRDLLGTIAAARGDVYQRMVREPDERTTEDRTKD